MKKNLWCAILVCLIAGRGVNAKSPADPNELLRTKCGIVLKYPTDPNELVRTRWDAIVKVLQNKNIDQKMKKALISAVVTPIFDFPLMAKLALGRKHWPKFNTVQREKFTKLFAERIRSSYVNKISLYSDEQGLVKPARPKGTAIYIPMELISKDKKVAILYKLRKLGKRWKIYDVEIQGVSVLLTYRSQFDDILRKNTVENLLLRLEKPPAPKTP